MAPTSASGVAGFMMGTRAHQTHHPVSRVSIFVSLWLVPQRGGTGNPGYGSGHFRAAVGIPYFLWQWTHDWYFLSFAAATPDERSRIAGPGVPLESVSSQQPRDGAGLAVRPDDAALQEILDGAMLTGFLPTATSSSAWPSFHWGDSSYFMIPMYGTLIAAGSVGIER